MAINFECPECAKKLRVPDELAGQEGKCPACGKIIEIPASRAHEADRRGAMGSSGEGEGKSEPFMCPNCNQMLSAPAQEGKTLVTCPSCAATVGVEGELVTLEAPLGTGGAPEWFLTAPGGQQHGPVSGSAIIQWIQEGRVPHGSTVWRQGMSQWLPVQTTPPFSSHMSRAAASVTGQGARRRSDQSYCSNCGALVDLKAVICLSCGASLSGRGSALLGHSPNWGVMVGAALVIMMFFLPWVDFVLFSCGGYVIPSKLRSLARAAAGAAGGAIPSEVQWRLLVVNLLYAIPFLAAGAIWAQAAGARTRRNLSVAAAIGILAILGACLWVLSSPPEGTETTGIFDFLAFGFYGTVVGAFVMLGSTLYSGATSARRPRTPI